MKRLHVKRAILALLMMVIVSAVSSCGRKEVPPEADSGQADAAPSLSVNCSLNQLVASNDALYTIIDDELVRFSPSDRRTETIGHTSKLLGSPVERFMLFHADGHLWLLSAENNAGDSFGQVQLAPLNAAAGALEEPNYTLPGWPDAAAFHGKQFFFSRVTDQTDGQAALHKLDITNDEIQIVNSDSVFEIVSGKTEVLYIPFKMRPLNNGMFVPDAEMHPVICSYGLAQGKEIPTAVEVDFPVFAELGERYVTIHETDDRKDNYELRLRDQTGQTQKAFSFSSAFSWPALLSNGQHLTLMTRNRTGDAMIVLDRELNVLGEWLLNESREIELLAMDPTYVYISQKDLPKEKDQPVTASLYRLEYLKKDAAIEEIFIR